MPCDQSSTVSASGERVRTSRSRRSTRSASGTSMRNGVTSADTLASSSLSRTLEPEPGGAERSGGIEGPRGQPVEGDGHVRRSLARTQGQLPELHVVPRPQLPTDVAVHPDCGEAQRLVEGDAGRVGQGDAPDGLAVALGPQHGEEGRVESLARAPAPGAGVDVAARLYRP